MERVYLDTNVLFPMTLMDLMLSMAENFHTTLSGVTWRGYAGIGVGTASCKPLLQPEHPGPRLFSFGRRHTGL